MEYKIIKSDKDLYGVYCNHMMVVPCKYRSIKPIEGTDFLLVECMSGIVINTKYIPAKNVLNISDGFNLMFEEDFYYYDIINDTVVPKRTEPVTLKKTTIKPYRGYMF